MSVVLSGQTLEEEWARFKAARRGTGLGRHWRAAGTGATGSSSARGPVCAVDRNSAFLRELDQLTAMLRARSEPRRPWKTRSIISLVDADPPRPPGDVGGDEPGAASEASSVPGLSQETTTGTWDSERGQERGRGRDRRRKPDLAANRNSYERKVAVMRSLETDRPSLGRVPQRSPSEPTSADRLRKVRKYIQPRDPSPKVETFDADTDGGGEQVDEMEVRQLQHVFQLNGVDLGPEGCDTVTALQGRPRSAQDSEFFEEFRLNERKPRGRFDEPTDHGKPFDIPAAADLHLERSERRQSRKPHGGTEELAGPKPSAHSAPRGLTPFEFPPTPTFPPPPVPKRRTSTPHAPDEVLEQELGRAQNPRAALQEDSGDVADFDDPLVKIRRQSASSLRNSTNDRNVGTDEVRRHGSHKKEVSFKPNSSAALDEFALKERESRKVRSKQKPRKYHDVEVAGEDVVSEVDLASPKGAGLGGREGRLKLGRKKSHWSISGALQKFIGGEKPYVTQKKLAKTAKEPTMTPTMRRLSKFFGEKPWDDNKTATSRRPVIGPPVLRSAELEKV